MSLNYELGGIDGWQELREKSPGTVECMIFASMFVGLNRIEAEGKHGWREFAIRLAMWETVHGPIASSGEPISHDVVRRFIGLTTNASPMTATQFRNQLGLAIRRKATEKLDRLLADETGETGSVW